MSARSRIITIIIVLALSIYGGISLYNFYVQHVEIYESLQSTRQEVAELQTQIASLEFMIDHIDDPDVIIRIAEEVFGLVLLEDVPIDMTRQNIADMRAQIESLKLMVENIDNLEFVSNTAEEVFGLVLTEDAANVTSQSLAEIQEEIAYIESTIENIDDPDAIRRIAEEILGIASQNGSESP